MAERKHIPEAIRDTMLRETGYRCAVPTCNTTLAIDLHHIVEVSKGGANEPSNLLALCPTCHALHHRGVITAESIRVWKARIVAINHNVDARAEIAERARTVAETAEAQKGLEQRKGFSLAVSEFLWRTCEVGFVYADTRFVCTGYCCFVGPRTAITIAEVADWAGEAGAARGGRPSVWTARGFAPFVITDRSKWDGMAVLEIGEIDDAYVKELLAEHKDPETAKVMAAMFVEPLQTPARYRMAPYVGEQVAFLNAPDNSSDYRPAKEFQVESATVSFMLKRESSGDFAQYVLTPVLSKIDHRGAPVFTESGRLVGLVRDSILLPPENAWRPVVTSLVPVLDVFREEAEDR